METRFSSSDPGAGPERRGIRTRRRKRNLEGGRVRRTGAGPAVQTSKGTSTKKVNLIFNEVKTMELKEEHASVISINSTTLTYRL
jgi:hypothetical protein